MFRRSRDRIKSMDAVLTLNFDKNGKKNYIGGSTFLELYEAFMEDKKIYFGVRIDIWTHLMRECIINYVH